MKKQIVSVICLLFCTILQAEENNFGFKNIIRIAEDCAHSAYSLDQISDDSPLAHLTYDQYRTIRFNTGQDIWSKKNYNFKLELLPAGYLFKNRINLYIITNGIPSEIKTDSASFSNISALSFPENETVPVSGFRILTSEDSTDKFSEFFVFQGASYFRAIPFGGQYGLSARGIVINPSNRKPEEFPIFKTFWIREPEPEDTSLIVYALLDGSSVTGAYQFVITPGTDTVTAVKAVLFLRAPAKIGIAPLTSMFLFDESNRANFDDFRTGVHDSDGFWLHNAQNEIIWRQLINPSKIFYASFTASKPEAFGLVQRSRNESDYQDFEARYENRPDAWITPGTEWPEGTVDLLEIPSKTETNDNIVTFWNIKKKLEKGVSIPFSYTLHWSMKLPENKSYPAKVMATRCGQTFSRAKNARLFVIDFSKTEYTATDLKSEIETSCGKIINQRIEHNDITGGERLTFELHQEEGQTAELRARLLHEDVPVTETWLYRWENTNDN